MPAWTANIRFANPVDKNILKFFSHPFAFKEILKSYKKLQLNAEEGGGIRAGDAAGLDVRKYAQVFVCVDVKVLSVCVGVVVCVYACTTNS